MALSKISTVVSKHWTFTDFKSSYVWILQRHLTSLQCKATYFCVLFVFFFLKKRHKLVHGNLAPGIFGIKRQSKMPRILASMPSLWFLVPILRKFWLATNRSCDLVCKIHRSHSGFNFMGVTQNSSWDFIRINPM